MTVTAGIAHVFPEQIQGDGRTREEEQRNESSYWAESQKTKTKQGKTSDGIELKPKVRKLNNL